MICIACGSECIYLGNVVKGNEKGLKKGVPLYGCKLCFRMFWKGKDEHERVIKGCKVKMERPIR